MMYDNRQYRHRKPYQNSLGGLAAGIFLIALAVAIFLGSVTWHIFLPILFVGLAFASLLGAFSSYQHKAAYGGLQGFVWLLGLALCFAIGFWPWILLPVAVTMILGALLNPIMTGLAGAGFVAASQAPQQPYPPQQQAGDQQGYQAAPPQTANQEGSQPHTDPQARYPEQQQELPPIEQQQ
jgi:hypothetical protein